MNLHGVEFKIKGFPYGQIAELAELAWKLGIEIKEVKLSRNYGVDKIETDFGEIKISL